MIRIAVCDDEPCFTQQISHVIANHARDISPSPETVLYTSSGQLLYDVEEGAHFDLLLLDIEMPVMDGISVARDARKVDDYIIIIFITNMAQYAIHGYEVNALDYVIKPIAYYPFSVKLRRAIRMIRETSGNSLLLPFDGEDRRIPTKDILYVEVHSHTI